MIVEVRSYRIKPGRREEFIRFFETRSIPALRAHGIAVLVRAGRSHEAASCLCITTADVGQAP